MDEDLDQYFKNEDDHEENDESSDEEIVDNIDPNYELERAEPAAKSAGDFAKFLQKTEFPDEIQEYLKTIKWFEKNAKNGDVVPTKSLKSIVSGFCQYLTSGKRIQKPVLRGIFKIFGKFDLVHYIAPELAKVITNLPESRLNAWFNVFHFLCLLPHPTDKITKSFFRQFCARTPFNEKDMKKRKFSWISGDWDALWMSLLNGAVPDKLTLKLIPFVTENVISKLKTPFKTADFFYKMFDKTDFHGILSLAAIFRLISEHNFEYPKFYDKVYSLTNPALLYMNQKEKIVNMLDNFLSSTHIPTYITASFLKRFSRCLLLAPIDAQEPILGLIRNLLIRHPNCIELIHRVTPTHVENDPFDDEAASLHETKALESSLWELKMLQTHWNQSVRKRAHFIDKSLYKIESYVRFKCSDELFSVNMAKSFGGEDGEAEKYRKLQDGEEDEEKEAEPRKKRGKFGGKFAAKHEEKVIKMVGINENEPKGILERKIACVDVPDVWRI